MSNLTEDEQVIRQFMKDQLHDRKKDNPETDNSFIFLEKETLDMLMNHLLNNTKQRASDDSQVKMIEVLEQIITDNQKEFEAIITFLKERS
ncbi:hypothetical protein [Sporosarcina beigongshangi]|uniref:hypothetical protein n=1 Tax=Sporosarcina beigongshangi TaxID=2782538 RepID=UPI001939E584|nr:hypothetical protein [Sporosarcina beigongshangi]